MIKETPEMHKCHRENSGYIELLMSKAISAAAYSLPLSTRCDPNLYLTVRYLPPVLWRKHRLPAVLTSSLKEFFSFEHHHGNSELKFTNLSVFIHADIALFRS